MLAGRAMHSVPAPLDELPLFVRAGAVLALLSADVDTLTEYGAGMPGLVRLADRTDAIHLLAFPRGARTGEFAEHGRWRSEETPGHWTLVVRAERRSQWMLEASLGTLMTPFVPCTVRVNGRPAADERVDVRCGH